ncbi:MAG: flagellar filament capping protein FliD [Clostridiales bacterium]|nr:flagellar filament capping protein FliD [Clostridiales bacterium]
MASITSLSNSSYNTSSIYGSRNVLSGLASGMDTESMIENAVSGIKKKIQTLTQKRTKIEWKQEAYRSIIDKAANLNTKYTSYTSKTNLLSSSFFTNAVNTAVLGTYKDKITASGKSSSDIKINAVKQMATAATYTVSGLAGISSGDIQGITGKDFDISDTIPVSTVSGTLTFQYGGANGTTFDISFDELEDLNEMEGNSSAEKLANAINKKLSEITYNYTKNGFQETTTADKAIKAVANADGRIVFQENELKNGNDITISSATGKIKSAFGLSSSDNKVLKVGNTALSKDTAVYRYLSDKELGITFNGTTKKISMANVIKNTDVEGENANQSFAENLQKELDKAFGTGKITASYGDGKLSLTPNGKGDVMTLGGSAVKALGFETGDANYVNTSKKLTDILGDKASGIFSQANRLKGASAAIQKTTPNGNVYYVDSKGNRVDKDGYRIDSDGKAIYDFEINGAHINVTEDTTLEGLMNSINSNADAGVKVSYSKLTNEFKFTTSNTGANTKIEFGGMAKALFDSGIGDDVEINHNFADNYGFYLSDGDKNRITISADNVDLSFDVDNTMTMQDFADKINSASGGTLTASYNEKTGQFSVKNSSGKEQEFTIKDQYGFNYKREIEPVATSTYTAGQDAIMDVEINGMRFENLTRSSNSFDLDGLTVNVKGTFEAVGKDGEDYEPITFNTTTDTEKIIDAIRQFVNDYNEMASELKSAYSTLPAQQSNGSRYEPLTADDESSMSESEIASYNEKAKQGILFGDNTLSSMYSKLLSAITPGGADGQTLREIGLNTSYSNGMTTISLDEDKLRTALESDPDKVKNAFTKTREGGSSSDGLMQTLQNTLNTYVKTVGEPKGVLITKAGSVKAPTSLNSNSLKSQIDSIDSQITRWQNKMSDQIDRYSTKFSRLEQLIAEMNSQSSAFAGLMGGDSGY